MAMQESGKGSGDGKAPVLSDEQAEEFAASFTPAWDTDDGLGDDTNGTQGATQVDAPAAAAAPAPAPAPAPAATTAPNGLAGRNHPGKQTLIGTAPQANTPRGGIRAVAPSSEAIDPENILESNTAPQPPIAPSVPPPAPPATAPSAKPQMKTQVMPGAPGPVAAPVAAKTQSKPAPAPTRDAKPIAVSADPFAARARSPRSADDEDFVPKKSKTLVFVIAGLGVAAAVGMIAKFGLSDDPPPAPPAQMVTGPAVTTAEIPPPPPKVEAPAPAPSPVIAPVTAAKAPEPLPAPTSTPTPPAQAAQARTTPPETPPHSAPAAQPRQPRGAALAPPQAAAAPPPAAAQPKTPPKPATTGIVRDNPF